MTKKFVARLTADGYASSRSCFLIPSMDGSPCFEEILTGKRHDVGYLVYTGRDINRDDVITKLGERPSNVERLTGMIDSYLTEITKFKVGNVVAIEASDDANVQLRLVSSTPKSRPGPRLPWRPFGRTSRSTGVAGRAVSGNRYRSPQPGDDLASSGIRESRLNSVAPSGLKTLLADLTHGSRRGR